MQNQQQNSVNNIDVLSISKAMNAEDDITIRELFAVIWKGKWLVLLITVIFAVGAVAFALSKPNIYKSSILLAPATEDSNKMGALTSQFGGLASLAGVNLGSGSSNTTDLALAVLKSRKFLTAFVNRHDLKAELFASKKWDSDSTKLIFDTKLYDIEKNVWKINEETGESLEPTDWQVYKLISGLVVIGSDKKTSMVTVSIEFISPILAKEWVELLISDLNKEMREADSEEVDRNIKFLKSNLEATSLADMRTVFYQLIEEQLKTKMLSQVQIEYAFKTIDPAVVAEEKSKPKRALIAVLGTLLGGMLSVMLVLMGYFMRNKK
ncbi:Wzz/FepE/Etk N-terminal domain-containing protein [Psychromonas aquimarina]|uniref:Wzz/FepE/Etk N-terminal domain-containing protein n=1 Tax=Psychromonas aquimarina TaxID=444919 RepID=UPI00041CF18F|nr:Wzz/FepE/Etk N-terminal domain-containing protein [Psychromonas aquimarina]